MVVVVVVVISDTCAIYVPGLIHEWLFLLCSGGSWSNETGEKSFCERFGFISFISIYFPGGRRGAV